MFSANTSQVSNDVKYIEDFFSAWLRTGTGSSQTVTTGIKENTGALVISKSRSAATDWAWYDTFRGATKDLASNTTAAETTQSQGLTAFNTDGHTWGTLAKVNTSGATYVDFVLKPTPKFFDVVTYTGNGVAGRTVPHNLGSVPGCIIIKQLNDVTNWITYHRANTANPETDYLQLNSTAATIDLDNVWNDTAPTSTEFTLGINNDVNKNGGPYVAYLFAHNAGGFGLTGTDNVISCGSFTTDAGGNFSVSLGYEPQLVIVKRTDAVQNWFIADTMRGFSQTQFNTLNPNLNAAETANNSNYISTNATGFGSIGNQFFSGSASYIYIAIRRGPMKTPTTGTSVFAMDTSKSTGPAFVSGFPVDMEFYRDKASVGDWYLSPRLTSQKYLITNKTNAEASGPVLTFDFSNGWGATGGFSTSTNNVSWMFRRAPGFMDVCCYTGTGATNAVQHNLGVTPEMVIVKRRNAAATNWSIYNKFLNGGTNPFNYALYFDASDPTANDTYFGAAPTSTTFTVKTRIETNASGGTYVAYLFASCPGVSKVGSYTGTGTTQQINCGFTGGARFVLIKRIDSTGDWYVWDSARGIVAGNDPYLLLNSTAAEVTGTDYVDTYSAGFEISSTAPAALNASGGSYIFLAIA